MMKVKWETAYPGRAFVLMLLLWLGGRTATAQVYTMPHNGVDTLYVDMSMCGTTILDPGGEQHYGRGEDSWLYIISTMGRFRIEGHYDIAGDPSATSIGSTADIGDYLAIHYDATNTSYKTLYTGNGFASKRLTRTLLHFHSDPSTGTPDDSTGWGLELHITYEGYVGDIDPFVLNDSAYRITWRNPCRGTRWRLGYGLEGSDDTIKILNTADTCVILTGLEYPATYWGFITCSSIPCSDTTRFRFCTGGTGCIDFTDLFSCHTKCFYGTFRNPEESEGVYNGDSGTKPNFWHHETYTSDMLRDTAGQGWDPRTMYQLRIFPEGHTQSVRLGNWSGGSQAERIRYDYVADTLQSKIILLRYAAVLQNPGHDPDKQPRLKMAFLNDRYQELSETCYTADFVANDTLEWGFGYDSTVRWKDWTPIAVDVSDLHGQRIYIELTTYDCSEGGHFGYAWFTLECANSAIETEFCGNTDEYHFTAPEGFRYEWYSEERPSNILCTEREFRPTQSGVYKCRCYFDGRRTGNECYMEKTAVADNLYPYAKFDYEYLDTSECSIMVQFYNRTTVTRDTAHTSPTGMECTQFRWIIDGADTLYTPNPLYRLGEGSHEIRLTASIADGSCTDDTVIRIDVPLLCTYYDTMTAEICAGETYTLRDSTFSAPGTYTVVTQTSYDTIQETQLNLVVHTLSDTSLTGAICNGMPYTYFGFDLDTPGDYVNTYTDIYGCDSIYRLHLITSDIVTDTTLYPEVCDNTGFRIGDSMAHISGLYTDTLKNSIMCDSIRTIHLTVNPTYNNIHDHTICTGDSILFNGLYYKDSGMYVLRDTSQYGCDSLETLKLSQNPTYGIYDTNHLCQHGVFVFDGWEYTSPGSWEIPYTTVEGCDSIHHLTLYYYDSLYHADMLLSLDSIYWFQPDTMIEVCAPLRLHLRNSSAGDSCLFWDYGDGATATQESPTHIYAAGSYILKLITTSPEGCRDTMLTNSIKVFAPPQAGYTWEPYILQIPDPKLTLTNTSQPDDSMSYYLWNIQLLPEGSYDTTSEKNPEWQFSGNTELEGMHEIWMVAYQDYPIGNGEILTCTDTISDSISITNTFLQFPNLVTPNGDGHNDTYAIVNLVEKGNYPLNRLTIYDRWGNIVYDKENIADTADFWDPEKRGNPDGTYYYRFHGQGRFGHIDRKGTIEVLRSEK